VCLAVRTADLPGILKSYYVAQPGWLNPLRQMNVAHPLTGRESMEYVEGAPSGSEGGTPGVCRFPLFLCCGKQIVPKEAILDAHYFISSYFEDHRHQER